MTPIPHAQEFDLSGALLKEGYPMILRRRQALGSDLFRSRIMLRDALFMGGAEAARVFYERDAFTRNGAMPSTAVRLLQDKGSVQTLDGGAHRLRKAMFLKMMQPEQIERLRSAFAARWRLHMADWSNREQIVLAEAIQPLLTETACDFAGIPKERYDTASLTEQLSAMIENAGSVGPRHWQARRKRRRAEAWAADTVTAERAGATNAPPGSPLALIARHHDVDGAPLTLDEAAVELLNVVRPIVAVERFIVFAAHALVTNKGMRERLTAGDTAGCEAFAQEVRRLYPFFPAIGGRARHDLAWQGHVIPKGSWVLFDLYGTNHDPELWTEPERFDPDRFRVWSDDPYCFVPQGGGYVETGHRCPGERVTLELIKDASEAIAAAGWHAPSQALDIDLTTIPTRPSSGVVFRPA
ncbi:cytochrome P450 [Amorphus coralli]|uniref:cytochrome P450 n=1 Tax=Amorphus coralli TaxID=340680 RepID=UPI00037CE6A6|nr:cytochrome P450 [Amorphus coralli]